MNKINWEDVDQRIVVVVALLRGAGFETFSSCQGGKCHAAEKPVVRILPDASSPIQFFCRRVAEELQKHGVRGFHVRYQFYVGLAEDAEIANEWVEVVFE